MKVFLFGVYFIVLCSAQSVYAIENLSVRKIIKVLPSGLHIKGYSLVSVISCSGENCETDYELSKSDIKCVEK